MSPVEFADLCQKGPQAVIDRLEVTENQAERLCGAGVSVLREIEELDLAPRALQRQFLFASHDPNLPVLGDAELIAELSTEIVGQEIRGHIGARGRLGSIDVSEVREAVEENLEGGRDAFERQRRMYGF